MDGQCVLAGGKQVSERIGRRTKEGEKRKSDRSEKAA